MAELERVQVLLARSHRRALAQIAKRERQSVSAVLRELIERGLAQRKVEQSQATEALRHLRAIRQAHTKRGVYRGDLVAEARAERQRQIEASWRKS